MNQLTTCGLKPTQMKMLARYHAITILRGKHYQQDNLTMYTILKECMVDSPARTFIK